MMMASTYKVVLSLSVAHDYVDISDGVFRQRNGGFAHESALQFRDVHPPRSRDNLQIHRW